MEARISSKLIAWGHSPWRVEMMRPWSLLSHYQNGLKNRGGSKKIAKQVEEELKKLWKYQE